VSDDGRYLILTVSEGTDNRNRLFYQDLHDGSETIELIETLEAAFEYLGNDGPVFFLLTDLDAPLSRVIAIDITQPDREHWQILIPEGDDQLELVKIIHDEFVAVSLHNAYHKIFRYDLLGKPLGEIKLPGLGSLQE
jgi:prolyl oligopeptidase